MTPPDLFTQACLILGLLLVAMTMGGSFIKRLPLSAAMLYLGIGMAIGPWGLGLLVLRPTRDVVLLERLTEVAVLISLFTAGMKLELPLNDRRWRIPVQLASVSMVITVAVIAAIGVSLMRMSPGAAILLGAILAPTDPVLASEVQVANPGDRDRLRFGLTGEGGLNDGAAFPFVMLGLGLLGLHELGDMGWRWIAVDVLWAVAGGLGIGYLLGHAVGRGILYLRVRHKEALGSDEFIALGLIALTYGVALLCQTYGFLAVFAAGLALSRIDRHHASQTAVDAPGDLDANAEEQQTSESAAPSTMMRAVQRFNSQLENFAEVVIVLAVGALIAVVPFRWEVLWFTPLLFLVVRPAAVVAGLLGTGIRGQQRRLMAWFGIRGIGSIYYLLYAIRHDISNALAEQLLSLVIAVVVASVVVHGISVTPLMKSYERRKSAAIARKKPDQT
ncbi:MAG: cation:proton antiporter [Polaromonas sp.]|uniref:cation:proton antiporter n=1 Tax=Polaromonas sp. TaxID=1869339 RepID=UPI0025F1D950|nr:cation:proton antiporter [Polaromonas sp.]MBI2727962.1 cation:proton antiporter [Polaromonas sp.]